MPYASFSERLFRVTVVVKLSTSDIAEMVAGKEKKKGGEEKTGKEETCGS